MTRIPSAALWLGLAGLLPFIWGAVAAHVPVLDDLATGLLGQRFSSPYILASYGTVILCFMAGVLWGFAAKGEAWIDYGLSVLPALFVFFAVGGGARQALLMLTLGFIGLLAIDQRFQAKGLAPQWWMSLRLTLTAVVLVCLFVGGLGA